MIQIDEANKIIEDAFPKRKIAYVTVFKHLFVYCLVPKDFKPGDEMPIDDPASVDRRTGELGVFSPLTTDVSGFSEIKKRNTYYYLNPILYGFEPIELPEELWKHTE